MTPRRKQPDGVALVNERKGVRCDTSLNALA
jgi:hypothetical protein